MADEDLVIRLPDPKEKEPPDVRRTRRLSYFALAISLCTVVFTGLNLWNARQARRFAEGPYIEVIKVMPENQSSLTLTIRNIGKTPAVNLRCHSALYTMSDFESGFQRITGWFGDGATLFVPDVPTSTEYKVYAYLPTLNMLTRLVKDVKEKMFELRGEIEYKDNSTNEYHTPFCYQIHFPDAPGNPGYSTCWSEGPYKVLRKLR